MGSWASLGSRVADLTANKRGDMYAFEAKSSSDDVDRAFYQCLEYLAHADYSILVTIQNMAYRKLKHFCRAGIGIWHVYEPGIIKQIASPAKQWEACHTK